MKHIIIIIAFGLLSQISAFSQGRVDFDINFGANPPPHTPGNPISGALLTNDLFYAILYLDDSAAPISCSIQELDGETFTTVFQFNDSIYASYPGGGPAIDYQGSWQLTDAQIQSLLAGQWYADVTYSDASYLGQITVVPEPSSVTLLLGGLAVLSASFYRRLMFSNKISDLSAVAVHVADRRWFSFLQKKIILGIFTSCLALAAPAQGIFEAPLGIGGLGLADNHFWFKVENNEVDFVAFVFLPYAFTPGTLTLDSETPLFSLDPVLSVPGSSVEFSLGEPQFSGLIGPARNPFLPPGPPLEPAGYDCDGNPYYLFVSTPGAFYSGHFDLPPGFLDELLAGNGKVQLNSSIGGNISVTPTPEPTTLALGLLGIGGLLFNQWRRCAFSTLHSHNQNHERKTP